MIFALVLRATPASVAACLAGLAATAGLAEEVLPEEHFIQSDNRTIHVTRFAAPGNGLRPAVLVLHGTSGIESNVQGYARYALALANNGIDAYWVRYFGPRSNARCFDCWDLWAETLLKTAEAIGQRPEASGHFGLLGFSLGGAVAVRSARNPGIDAVVVFYGFVPPGERLRACAERLPPFMVLHGDADDKVPLQDSKDLVEFVQQVGGSVELTVYPGAGHRVSTWDETAANDALRRMVTFFRAKLMARP